MIKRTAQAVWQGNLKEGKGEVSLGSGAYKGQYSFTSRFEEGIGTNPEELIGAAHAGCFSMALSAELSKAGFLVEEVQTRAAVNLGKTDAGFEITRITLATKAKVQGISETEFIKFASEAKDNCPVSKALASVEVVLEAQLLN
jgi:osmotically inducible protein OsmC